MVTHVTFRIFDISVLRVFSKVSERHVHDSLYNYLTENNLIYPRQSGFWKNHSTDTNLIQIIDELLFNLDKNRVSGIVLVDYCKAFDMVDHGLLLDKLKVYGVAGETMKWFQSYLVDRHQLVNLGGCVSDMALMKHGVPQGSILGPLFFTVFINDLPLPMSAPLKSIFMQTILQSHRQQIVAAWVDCRNLLIHLYRGSF